MALQGNLHYIIMQLNQNLNKTEKKKKPKNRATLICKPGILRITERLYRYVASKRKTRDKCGPSPEGKERPYYHEKRVLRFSVISIPQSSIASAPAMPP